MAEQREHEREEELERLQDLVYKLDSEMRDGEPIEREAIYSSLLRALLEFFFDEQDGRTAPVNGAVAFVDSVLAPALKKFSKTQEELRYMQAKMLEFLISVIQNEAARELSNQELRTPEVIYGHGKAGTSPAVIKPIIHKMVPRV